MSLAQYANQASPADDAGKTYQDIIEKVLQMKNKHDDGFFYILDTIYFHDLAFVPRVNVAPQD